MMQRILSTVLGLLTALLTPGIAVAYVGPGAGLTAIGTVLALIGAVLLGIVGFIWYPIKRLLRRKQVEELQEVDENSDDIMSTKDQTDPDPRQK